MTAAVLGVSPGAFDPAPPPRLLWAAAFVAVAAVHAGVAFALLDRPVVPSAYEAPEPVTLIDLPPAPPATGDSALQLPAAPEVETVPMRAPDARATTETPDDSAQVSEAAVAAEPVEDPPREVEPMAAPPPLLEIPPTLEPPPLAEPEPELEIPPELLPPETPVEETPVVAEATVVLPAVIPPPQRRPEQKPVRREPAKVEKPKPQREATRREQAAPRTTGAPAAEKTVAGKPKSGAAPRASGGGADENVMRRYQAQVRADIQQQSRSLRVGQRGRVVVRFTFSRNGTVSGVTVARGSGSARLDQAAVQAVKRASPLPPAPEGVPGARFTWSLPIQFD